MQKQCFGSSFIVQTVYFHIFDECLAKPWLSAKINWSQKYPPPKPQGSGINMQYFPNIYLLCNVH